MIGIFGVFAAIALIIGGTLWARTQPVERR